MLEAVIKTENIMELLAVEKGAGEGNIEVVDGKLVFKINDPVAEVANITYEYAVINEDGFLQAIYATTTFKITNNNLVITKNKIHGTVKEEEVSEPLILLYSDSDFIDFAVIDILIAA